MYNHNDSIVKMLRSCIAPLSVISTMVEHVAREAGFSTLVLSGNFLNFHLQEIK